MIFSLKFEQKNTNANLKDGTQNIIIGRENKLSVSNWIWALSKLSISVCQLD